MSRLPLFPDSIKIEQEILTDAGQDFASDAERFRKMLN